ncbi:hypothetical protein GCM10029978_036880 [Actinoallomurus acanthiterrae]
MAGSPDTTKLISKARKEGRKAGRSKQYDPWSLMDGAVVPYVRELESRRDEALARIDLAENDAVARERVRQGELQERVAVTAEEAAAVEDELADVRRYMDGCNAQLDRLAMREARIGDEVRRRRRRIRRGDPDPEPPPHLPPGFVYETGSVEQVDESWRNALWEGPHGRRMRLRTKLLLLGVLALVETPITIQIFHYLESSFALVLVFALPVATLMVFVPHLAGTHFRGRKATGAERTLRWLPLALIVPWASLALILGSLRRKVLLVTPTDARGRQYPSLVGNLHLNPLTITVMFVALLLLSGGLAFMLGLADDHPLVAAYHGAARRQRDLLDGLRGDRTRLAAARQNLEGHEDRLTAARERAAKQREIIMHSYDAAIAAYLDAVVQEMRDPTITEAVTGFREREEGRAE